jgi:ribosome-binding protein aMBF1 (putative translation factor)
MEIHIFDTSVEEFIKNLQKPTIAKVLRTIDLLEKFGQKLGPPHMQKKTYKQLKRKLLKDKRTKEAYERLGPEFAVIEMIIKKRIERGLSQKELARKIGTKQSAISRLESGTYNPTIAFLQKVGKALGVKLKIALK